MTGSSGNRKIAKNTLFLYSRMLLLLVISLYTSRIILQTLGVEDYGIYNIVGGVVVLFTFINGALSTSTQRHLSFELGKEHGDVNKMFSACLNIHVVIGIVILILSETVGLWFVNSKLNIPYDRMAIANIVYQASILTCVVSIIQTPLSSAVIAYERMAFYAYYGIMEALLKLLSVFLLIYLPYDKLGTYAILQLALAIIMLASMAIYVFKNIGIGIVKVKDKQLYKFLLSFSSWTIFGSFATLMEGQGLNILLNIFYGVAVNAAVGIAMQVQGALTRFVSGFQQALNPQLIMSESGADRTRQFDLIFKSSKFSFLIMYALALPICANLDYILDLWLDVVPKFTKQICILTITSQMIDCMAGPLYTTIFAIGKIKTYQLVVWLLRFCTIFIGWGLCKIGISPYIVYITPCFTALCLLIYRFIFLHREIGISGLAFLNKVLNPIIGVILITIIPLVLYKSLYLQTTNIWSLILETLVLLCLEMVAIYFVGFDKDERLAVCRMIKRS
jgi:O-antigen/teichoic acid export membrane protein